VELASRLVQKTAANNIKILRNGAKGGFDCFRFLQFIFCKCIHVGLFEENHSK
jgi:hypothetical protein